MKDKLAEEILENLELDGDFQTGDIYYKHEVIKAMQAYHEAANKAVTDEDIKAYIDAHEVDDPILRKALRVGAGAMRDGLIKHIEP